MHTCNLVFDLTLRNRGTNLLRAQLSGWRKRRNKTLIFIVVKERSKYSVILFFFSFFHLRILLLFFLNLFGFFPNNFTFFVLATYFYHIWLKICIYFRLTYRLTKSQHEWWMLLWYVICRYQSIRFVNIFRTLWRFYAAFSKMTVVYSKLPLMYVQSTKTNVKFCVGKAEYTRIFR